MTKRKEKSQGKSKPKKRVAFSAPKTAATRAIITRNASTSPLLQLPPELRTKIWTEVLGNELIHIDYYSPDELSLEDNEQLHATLNWSNSLKRSYGNAWRHIVCENDCPEDSPWKKHAVEWDGEEEGRTYWYKPHELCSTDYDTTRPIEFWDHKTMRLTVLRTCRQVYVEANSILWTTNTFSFQRAVPFKRFMMTRTTHQKSLIRNLRLEIEWYLHDSMSCKSRLNKTLVNSLSGLRSLRLIMWHEEYDMPRTIWFIETSGFCKGLRILLTLPLTNVEVVVRSSTWYSTRQGFWAKEDREEVTEGLKKMLLAPKGVEVSPDSKEQEQS